MFDKQTKVKFSKKGERSVEGKLDCIHSNLWGQNRIPLKSGARYFMTLVDDYSRMVWLYVLKIKDEALSTFIKWKIMIEKQTER